MEIAEWIRQDPWPSVGAEGISYSLSPAHLEGLEPPNLFVRSEALYPIEL